MFVLHHASNTFYDCSFERKFNGYRTTSGRHLSLFGPIYQQRSIRLFLEHDYCQLGFVAHHIHLCFQARMSESTPQAVRQ